LHEGELAGAIDGDIEVEIAFSGLELSDVDVEIGDRISVRPARSSHPIRNMDPIFGEPSRFLLPEF
jgi:hypothetical protein